MGGQGRAGVAQAVGTGGGRVDRAGGGRRGEGGQRHAALVQGAPVGHWSIISEVLEGQVGLECLWAEEGELEAGVGGAGPGGSCATAHWKVPTIGLRLLGGRGAFFPLCPKSQKGLAEVLGSWVEGSSPLNSHHPALQGRRSSPRRGWRRKRR